MKSIRAFLFFAVITLAILGLGVSLDKSARNYLASLFFPEGITPEQLKSEHENKRTNILIIPGHFNNLDFGARFNGVRESELTKGLAGELENTFRIDPRFQVFTEKDLASYLEDVKETKNFLNEAVQATKNLVSQGSFKKERGIVHTRISDDDALKLYAVNKWANDHNIDIVIHVHFNDYPGRGRGVGDYSGFAIYIPEKQLPSYRASKEIADGVSKTLNNYFPASNNPLESGTVIEDQNLIATGAFGTLRAISLLIEYGYVYEPQIINTAIRGTAFRELANQTYLGIKRYLEPENENFFDTISTLPHQWKKPLPEGLKNNLDVFALQIALAAKGFYPPAGFSKNDCPPSGNFGPCTKKSVMNFQKNNGLPPTGLLDEETINRL